MYEFITPNGEELGKRKGFPLRRRNNILAPQFTVFNFRIIPHFCEKEHCAPPCLYERRAAARRTRGRAMQTAQTARKITRQGTKKAAFALNRLRKAAFYFLFSSSESGIFANFIRIFAFRQRKTAPYASIGARLRVLHCLPPQGYAANRFRRRCVKGFISRSHLMTLSKITYFVT